MRTQYGYQQVHRSGFPLGIAITYDDRQDAIKAANAAYRVAVNTQCAAGSVLGLSRRQDQSGASWR